MAFGRTLAHRFLEMAKGFSAQVRPGGASAAAPSARCSVLRRSGLQRRPIVQAAVPPDRISLPIGGSLPDRLWGFSGDRFRPDILAPASPPPPTRSVWMEEADRGRMGMTTAEVRKVLKASQIELVRSRLRAIPSSSVPYSEFLRICGEASGVEQGKQLARSLDDSGVVIVLGNAVFLRPELVAKAIERVIPLSVTPGSDSQREELKELEKMKAMIDKAAAARVRRELWCGLGLLAAQTAGFMRLTFWELSWDVMEPICFYVTSFYVMAGFVFFMRTSTDPSFEGFFRSRFATKQQQLMKAYNFDLCRFTELRQYCHRSSLPPLPEVEEVGSSCCECNRSQLLGAADY